MSEELKKFKGKVRAKLYFTGLTPYQVEQITDDLMDMVVQFVQNIDSKPGAQAQSVVCSNPKCGCDKP